MKPLLIAVVAATLLACQWDEAERSARCRAGDPTACGEADAGLDAGDARDAGTGDGGQDAGREVSAWTVSGAEPFALHEGPGGAVWVVTRFSGQPSGYVALFSDGGLTALDYPLGLSAVYANPDVAPELLVALLDGGAYLLTADGGRTGFDLGPRPAAALASVYALNGAPFSSFWSAREGTTYDQVVIRFDGGMLLPQGEHTCASLAFHDVEVLPALRGGAGLVGWSASCANTDLTPARGISVGTGVQVISPNGDRVGLPLDGATALRLGASPAGFEVLTTQSDTRAGWERYDWRSGVTFDHTASASFSADGGLTIGDVMNGYLTVHARGAFSTDGGTWPMGDGGVLLVRPGTGGDPRMVGLTTRAQGRLPLLVQTGAVFVLWLDESGTVRLTKLPR